MTGSRRPLVSVLIPAHNAETTLAETLRSALASGYSKLEIVLVDDGSTDATAAVAEELSRGDERVRIFRQPHRGVSGALNFGLAQVRGEFVARLDGDDLWHQTKIEKQVGMLIADPSLSLVYSYVRYVDQESRIIRDAPVQDLSGSALCRCLYGGIIGGGSSAIFRKAVLERVAGYEKGLEVWEDLLLHLRLAAEGQIGVVPEYLTAYRVRRGSSSAGLERSLASWRQARHLIQEEFGQVPPTVHRWSHARRIIEIGEGFARKQQYAKCLALLGESFFHDPARTFLFLAHRFSRRLRGNGGSRDYVGPRFAEARPGAGDWPGVYEMGLRRTKLARFDSKRTRGLESLDQRLAGGLKLTPRPRGDAGTSRRAQAGS